MGRYGLFLSELLPEVPFSANYSLKAHTTIGVGGTGCAFFPQSLGQLRSVVRACERCRIRYVPLGGGSNVLPSDGEFGGVFIVTDKFDHIAVEEEYVTAECGASVGKFLSVCRKNGLCGAEFLAGIPARLGGVVFMNAGTSDGRISDLVECVTFLQGSRLRVFSREECAFSYKESIFQHRKGVVLSVRMKLFRASEEEASARLEKALKKRRSLPAGRSMGCVFKNPSPEISAGKLIESCGCKGMREGGAKVSEEHANFMLNEENARAEDFYRLIKRVKEEVYARTGILLQEEIQYIK